MSIEIACDCEWDEIPEFPAHSHIYDFQFTGKYMERVDTGEIRIWVPWKALVRELMSI